MSGALVRIARMVTRGLHRPMDPGRPSDPDRIASAEASVAAGSTDPSRWYAEHSELSTREALSIVGDAPDVDRPVVCHGDACAPNTIDDDGRWSGHVDLGTLGVADRWADLAIATWSTEWNYGPGWQGPLASASPTTGFSGT